MTQEKINKNIFYPGDRMKWDIYRKVLKKIKFSDNEKILDAGCGQGILSDYLKISGLYGFDFNPKSLEIAKTKGYAEVKIGDMNKIPYKNKEFDKTICIEVFQYLEKPNKAFEELIRVTKNEIIICVPNYNCIGIRSILQKKCRKLFFETLNRTYFPTNQEYLEDLAKKFRLNLEIKYVSSRGGWIRDIFGNLLSSEIIGIYKIS